MYIVIFAFLGISFPSINGICQAFKPAVPFVCNYYDAKICKEVLNGSFKVDKNAPENKIANEIINTILEVSDMKDIEEFQVQEVACVANACALQINNDRFILFNKSFFDNIYNLTNSRWTTIAILAHEVGHHILGHTLRMSDSLRHKYELKADKWSGFILWRLNAGWSDAQAALAYMASENASKSHPSRESRLKALMEGYLEAKKKYPRGEAPKTEAEQKTIKDTVSKLSNPSTKILNFIAKYKIRNLSRLEKINSRNKYEITFYIDGTKEELDLIESVTYQLHETFTKPIQVIYNAEDNFSLKVTAWGVFNVPVTIKLKDGRSVSTVIKMLDDK